MAHPFIQGTLFEVKKRSAVKNNLKSSWIIRGLPELDALKGI